MGERFNSTSGSPEPAGACTSCGGQTYFGLVHSCGTGVNLGNIQYSPDYQSAPKQPVSSGFAVMGGPYTGIPAEELNSLQQELAQLRADNERLIGQLAECYRLSGADPDGNEDWRLAESAVNAVRELRKDSDEESAKLEAELREALQDRDLAVTDNNNIRTELETQAAAIERLLRAINNAEHAVCNHDAKNGERGWYCQFCDGPLRWWEKTYLPDITEVPHKDDCVYLTAQAFVAAETKKALTAIESTPAQKKP